MNIIGFIGLGLMGRPMAEHLLDAGFPLIVHNRSRAPVDALAARGAQGANSPQEVAEASDIVFTLLPDPEAVAQVIGGKDGLIEYARRGAIVIDMSTSPPQLASELAERARPRRDSVLDAPVSGGQIGAREATLSIMVGGDAGAFERALPLLRHLGKNIVHVGGSGAGQIVKAANQIIVGLTIEAVAEALTFVGRAGVDPALAREAMLGGFATSRVLEVHGRRMLERDFVPGGRAVTHLKDLTIALDMAQQPETQLPITLRVAEMYRELVERGFGDEDHAALWRIVADEWEV